MSEGIRRTIVPLDHITLADEPHSGAKAYNCARLRQAGFRVPDGLVVLATATDDELAAVADHPWFDRLPAEQRFAVRSSGIGEDGSGQSFAGIHRTTLDVSRADLVRAVRASRASGHSAPAPEYRRAHGVSTESIQMGVLIQRMIQPVAAGVAFTANPVTGAADELVINSSWGTGEALVSGQVDPDELVVRKHDGALLWSRTGEKTGGDRSRALSLSPHQVRELASVLLDIERHYGAPQDVEWCHDGTELWVVQSRPVTTDPSRTGEIEWTRANLAEVLPDVTSPQALAAFEDLLNRAERQFLGALLAPEQVLGPLVKSFCGRLYFNLSQLLRMSALGGVAPAVMFRSMGHAGVIQPIDEAPPRLPIIDRLASMPDLARILWRHLRAARSIREHEARMRAYLDRLTTDPRRLADGEVWSAVEEWFRDAPDAMQTVLVLGGVTIHETPVRSVCDKVGFPFEQLVYPQLAAGERSVSAQQAYDLSALAASARHERAVARHLSNEAADVSQLRVALRGTAFLADFERFLEKYGHRGRYESDWSLPRYREDPTPLLRALRAHVAEGSDRAVADTAARQDRESTDAWAAFTDRLSRWQRWTALPLVRGSVRRMKQYYVWRERVRSDLARVLAALRAWHLALAERFVERGWLERRDDYFLLRLEEIGRVIEGHAGPDTLRGLAADRRAEAARHRAIQMPMLMRERDLTRLMRTAGVSSRSADESQLSGHPVSGGCVEAEVVVVRDPDDFGRMKRGAIIVAPATDPSWTPLFTLASGVIVEVGGVLSHASTIAREYGLPALANVRHATKRLRTGERVRLDAIKGLVRRLERPMPAWRRAGTEDDAVFARYLGLLGVTPRAPGLEALTELVAAHLTRIPFENVSKLYHGRREAPPRRPPDLVRYLDGIERHHLGGTCYANAFNLHQLLAHLGYDVSLCGADMSAPDVHLVNIVRVEGRPYLVDVGYGAPFLEPLPLDLAEDQEIAWGRERYVLTPRDAAGRSRLELHRDGELRHGYTVNPAPRQIEEFAQVIADSFSDGATFMHALLIARFWPTRSVTLRNLTLIEAEGTRYRLQQIPDRDDLPAVIEEHFRIPRGVTREALDGVDLTMPA